jgi:hypothetical protein
MQAEVFVQDVVETRTRSGTTRYVLRDADGREYSTFRPPIGSEAARYRGRRARIEFHEEDRGGFHNVYLDSIAPVPEGGEPDGEGSDADEVAWSTAVEAAPWLVGSREPEEAVEPDELFERLEPFKRRVAEDIREGGEQGKEGDGGS